MERKIGEIFEYQGEWYQCVELPSDYIGCICNICSMNFDGKCPLPIRECQAENGRSDRKDVIFKKLEKVGKPYAIYCPPINNNIFLQRYRIYETPIFNGTDTVFFTTGGYLFIDIEIKQKQEDMEEKKIEKPYIVYKHISPNGKEYIGMTRNLKKRWEGNGCSYKKNSEFRNDIMKYGWDNFQHIIVKDGLSVNEASKLEDELIVDAMNRGVAYNISRGGIGGAHPAWNKGIPLSKEQIEKLRAANLGKIMSEEARRKIGKASRGHIVSDETRRKIGDKNRGKKHSKEHTSKWIKSNMWRFHRVEIKKDGIFVGTYESIREAARSIGKSRGFINGIIQSPKGKHQGYTVIILD